MLYHSLENITSHKFILNYSYFCHVTVTILEQNVMMELQGKKYIRQECFCVNILFSDFQDLAGVSVLMEIF